MRPRTFDSLDVRGMYNRRLTLQSRGMASREKCYGSINGNENRHIEMVSPRIQKSGERTNLYPAGYPGS